MVVGEQDPRRHRRHFRGATPPEEWVIAARIDP
jgi:hypothetical protein